MTTVPLNTVHYYFSEKQTSWKSVTVMFFSDSFYNHIYACFLIDNIIYVYMYVLHSDLLVPFSEHTNEDDSLLFDVFNSTSSESNIFDTSFGRIDILSQETFTALSPIDLSSAQTCSPLLEMHTNDVSIVLFERRSKANRRLSIFLSSN